MSGRRKGEEKDSSEECSSGDEGNRNSTPNPPTPPRSRSKNNDPATSPPSSGDVEEGIVAPLRRGRSGTRKGPVVALPLPSRKRPGTAGKGQDLKKKGGNSRDNNESTTSSRPGTANSNDTTTNNESTTSSRPGTANSNDTTTNNESTTSSRPGTANSNDTTSNNEANETANTTTTSSSSSSRHQRNNNNNRLVVLKTDVANFIKKTLDSAQRSKASERKKLYKDFRKVFYREMDLDLANDHQKLIVQTLWSWSLLFFKAPNSPPIHAALKFILDVVLHAGTEEDKQEYGFGLETYPMYYYVIKLFLLSHKDERPLVRLRLINIAYHILKTYKDVPPIHGNAELNRKLAEALLIRLTDRNASVRAIAAAGLKFFVEEREGILKRLIYFCRYDPSPEVRRTLLIAFSDMRTIKTAFFYDFVFDPDQRVRLEAYMALSTRSMAHLTPQQCAKAVVWGLSHDDRMKKIVGEKLVAAWIKECGDSHIEFINRIGLLKKPSAIERIFDAVFPSNFSEVLDSVDLSFLNEDKLIPVNVLNPETALYLFYLVKKFGNNRVSKEKLLPNAEVGIEYMEKVIDEIHSEHQNALEEDREENATLLFSLAYLIPIVFLTGLEEGNRRKMAELLKEILLDSILDEAPIIKASVDALFKVTDKRTFTELMGEILREVFEPDKTLVEDSRPGSRRDRSRSRSLMNSKNLAHEIEGEEQMEAEIDKEQQQEQPSPVGSVGPTSSKPNKRVLTQKEVLGIRNKLCNLGIQRIRVNERKTEAVNAGNYLEAHRLQTEIDAICQEEQALREKLQVGKDGGAVTIADMSVASKSSGRTDETSLMEMEPPTDVEDDPQPPPSNPSGSRQEQENGDPLTNGDEMVVLLSQATTAGGDQRVGINAANLVKGILLANRFLCHRPKIIPIIRQFYESHALTYFSEANSEKLARIEIVNFFCLVGLIDPDEKRKVIGILITAIKHDVHPDVRVAAFKAIVDLLCQYEMKAFICTDSGGPVYGLTPPEFNSTESSPIDIQAMFVRLIDDFGIVDRNGPPVSPNLKTVKISGLLKLLLANRIVSETAVTDILCNWIDPANQSTKIPFDIGMWLPIYTKASLQNARIMMRALFESVVRIAGSQEEKSPYAHLKMVNLNRLVDFVLPYLSPSHLNQKDGDCISLHEELAEKILDHVAKYTKRSSNIELVQLLSKLHVENDAKAEKIVSDIGCVLVKLSAMAQNATIVSIKQALKKYGTKIAFRFEDMRDDLLKHLERVGGDDDENEDSDLDHVNPFSSDDEEENQGIGEPRGASISSGVPSRQMSQLRMNEDIQLKDDLDSNSNQGSASEHEIHDPHDSLFDSDTSSVIERRRLRHRPRLSQRNRQAFANSSEDDSS